MEWEVAGESRSVLEWSLARSADPRSRRAPNRNHDHRDYKSEVLIDKAVAEASEAVALRLARSTGISTSKRYDVGREVEVAKFRYTKYLDFVSG